MKQIAGRPGQPTAEDAEVEEHSDLPSSYCEIMVSGNIRYSVIFADILLQINDDLIYRTRTKQMTSAPYVSLFIHVKDFLTSSATQFSAGTERFIRDYKNTTVRVAVRDARLREHDALLGIVTLPLEELFKTQSEVTRLFSIQDGVGFGRINMSLLFKGVDVQLPPSMRGWETGTVEVLSDIRGTGLNASFASKRLVLRTTDDVEKVPRSAARQDGGDIIWALGKGEESVERRLPVYNRYASALVFDIGGTRPDAIAVLWLQDIVDIEEQEVELDVMEGKELDRLSQCYISEHTKISYVNCEAFYFPTS